MQHWLNRKAMRQNVFTFIELLILPCAILAGSRCALAQGATPPITPAPPMVRLPVTTSWLANTQNPGAQFPRTQERRYLMEYFYDIAASSDGFVYGVTSYSEIGNWDGIYKDGAAVVDSPWSGGLYAVAVTNKALYYGTAGKIMIYTRMPGQAINGKRGEGALREIAISDAAQPSSNASIAVDEAEDRLFTTLTGKVRVFHISTGQEIQLQGFKMEGVGKLTLDKRGNLWIIQNARPTQPTKLDATPFGSAATPGHELSQLNTKEGQNFETSENGGFLALDLGTPQKIDTVRFQTSSSNWAGAKIELANNQKRPLDDDSYHHSRARFLAE